MLMVDSPNLKMHFFQTPCIIYLGLTSLLYASKYGHLDVVRYLIHSGADISAKNNHGKLFHISLSYIDWITWFVIHSFKLKIFFVVIYLFYQSNLLTLICRHIYILKTSSMYLMSNIHIGMLQIKITTLKC